jgi:hypothetical protein
VISKYYLAPQTPATIKDVPPPPVEVAVVFWAKARTWASGTYDGDLAAAARLAGQDFDSIDKRADGFDNLRACYLVLQRLLEFPNLFRIEFRQIGVDNDSHIALLGHQFSIDVSLAKPPGSAIDRAQSQGLRRLPRP